MRTTGIELMISGVIVVLLAAAAARAVDEPNDPLAKLPSLTFQEGGFRGFKAVPFIRTAAAMQALGKDQAYELLRAYAKNHDREGNGIIVLSRMLFTKKAGGEFRRPMIGGAFFPGGTDYQDWPLEPIELVDGVPFVIVGSYMLGGRAESADSYISYCIKNCDWNDFRFKEKNEKELQAALEKLLSSPKWKTPLGNQEKEFFSTQIAETPMKAEPSR
jgi:hypothetical protein